MSTSDAALIQKIVQRDESALAALYDRYASLLSSVLNRILRDTQAAEEILQDVFFQLWRNAAQFDPGRGSLPGWLVVIARNRAISRLRRHNPSEGEELLETSVIVPTNLESAVAQQQLLGRVKGALENLSTEQRAAIELAYFEGLTHSEIATRTGDPLEHGENADSHRGRKFETDFIAMNGHPTRPEDFDLYALRRSGGRRESCVRSARAYVRGVRRKTRGSARTHCPARVRGSPRRAFRRC
jgi:RNA polymerase sigma-70 factor (ECF subfamily)